MNNLFEAVRGNFVLVNLGCEGDIDLHAPLQLQRAMTVVELDACCGAATQDKYYRKVALKQVVAGVAGRYSFRRNTFTGSSSLLSPNDDLVCDYGLEPYMTVAETQSVAAVTLPDLLQENGIDHLDFLKSDLEGLDFEVIKSCEPHFDSLLALQAELRFQPFYEGEPYFHEVVAYLQAHGYELLTLSHVDYYLYATPHRRKQHAGRAVWADAVFFKRPDMALSLDKNQAPLQLAKMILIAYLLDKANYGEHLFTKFGTILPAQWQSDLGRLFAHQRYNARQLWSRLRNILHPIELYLKHWIGKSQHSTWR